MGRLAAVTGATGFLGRYIVAALIAAGWRVRILTRQKRDHPQLAGLEFQSVFGDISDRTALRALVDGADAVIHAAGLIKAPGIAAFTAVNVEGTANLVDALLGFPSAHLILVSSMAAREPQLSGYAFTKRGGETLVEAMPGNWTIVRPCAVYGPWDRETLTIFRAAAARIFPLLGPKTAHVALIHAADAADAIARLCDFGPSARIFELTDQRIGGYTWQEIVAAAETAIGKSILTIRLPGPIVRAAAVVGATLTRAAGRTPIFTPGKAREVLHTNWGSTADRVPPPDIWQPKITLEEGFRDTVAWYRKRNWLPGPSNPHKTDAGL